MSDLHIPRATRPSLLSFDVNPYELRLRRAKASRHSRPGSAAASLCASVLCLAITTIATAADGDRPIYRSKAADGTVSFTDRPAPDAVVVEPGQISVIAADRPASASSGRESARESSRSITGEPGSNDPMTDGLPGEDDYTSEPTGEPEPTALVDTVVIASPPPDAHLLDASGPLLVEVGTSPGSLAESGLLAEVLIDGTVVSSSTESQVPVSGLDRGEHQMHVRLVDADGEVVAESEPQPLHVRRSSALITD